MPHIEDNEPVCLNCDDSGCNYCEAAHAAYDIGCSCVSLSLEQLANNEVCDECEFNRILKYFS